MTIFYRQKATPLIQTARLRKVSYSLFQRYFEDVQRFRLLPYNEAAETVYNVIPAEIRKQHSIDCHIAAVALSRDLIVVTSNLRHFQKIPGLKCVDWTLAEDSSP